MSLVLCQKCIGRHSPRALPLALCRACLSADVRGMGGPVRRYPPSLGMSGFHFRGGGSIEPPKTGGGGVWEKGSIDRHHSH